MTVHPISPVFDADSKILILGSFPSVKSREEMFFYGHPQNRFWRVLSAVFDKDVPEDIKAKQELLLSCGIALWDVIASCDIEGSSDSSIKHVVPNDLTKILSVADIRTIFVNGKTAEKFYNKYIKESIHRIAVCLPSTSPAHATWSLKRLTEAWQIIKS